MYGMYEVYFLFLIKFLFHLLKVTFLSLLTFRFSVQFRKK